MAAAVNRGHEMDAWIWVLISALVAGIVTLLIRFLPGLVLVSKGIDDIDDIKPGFGPLEEREVGNAGATWEWREQLDTALTSDNPQAVETALQELKRLRERQRRLEEDTRATPGRDLDEAIVVMAPRAKSSRTSVIVAVVVSGSVVLAAMTYLMLGSRPRGAWGNRGNSSFPSSLARRRALGLLLRHDAVRDEAILLAAEIYEGVRAW